MMIKKQLMAALLIATSLLFSGCANINVEDKVYEGRVERSIVAKIDPGSVSLAGPLLTQYLKGLGGKKSPNATVNVMSSPLETSVTIKVVGASMDVVNRKTEEIVNTGLCGVSINSKVQHSGYFYKKTNIETAIDSKCRQQFVSGSIKTFYKDKLLANIYFPSEKIITAEDIETNVVALTFLYLFIFFSVVVSIAVLYTFNFPPVVVIVDFFAPSFRKMYFQIILLLNKK